jgi:hypothetical protein
MPFDNEFEGVKDYSPYNNSGNSTENVFEEGGGVDGMSAFNSSKGYINLGEDSTLSNNITSISFWFKADSWSTINYGHILAKSGGGTGHEWGFRFGNDTNADGTSRLYFIIWGQSGTPENSVNNGAEDIILNKWYHIVGIADTYQTLLYIDGVWNATLSTRTVDISNTSSPLLIGTRSADLSTPDRQFNGTIDNILIFNRSISPEEVLILNASAGRMTELAGAETQAGDIWSAEVYPIDPYFDGEPVNSTYEGNVEILSTPTDSCTYDGSGNWNINGADNCYLTTDTYVSGTINFYGTGTTRIEQGVKIRAGKCHKGSGVTLIIGGEEGLVCGKF